MLLYAAASVAVSVAIEAIFSLVVLVQAQQNPTLVIPVGHVRVPLRAACVLSLPLLPLSTSAILSLPLLVVVVVVLLLARCLRRYRRQPLCCCGCYRHYTLFCFRP